MIGQQADEGGRFSERKTSRLEVFFLLNNGYRLYGRTGALRSKMTTSVRVAAIFEVRTSRISLYVERLSMASTYMTNLSIHCLQLSVSIVKIGNIT